MPSNKDLILHFYSSFQKKDYKSMQLCYDQDAVFSDEVFKGLDSDQVKAMWEMLIKSGKDLEIHFGNIEADEMKGKASWTATYTFSRTGRRVVNHIESSFIINEGKIIQQVDRFDFYQWAKQALGLPGLLLGWTSYLKKKVQMAAMKSLQDFRSKSTV